MELMLDTFTLSVVNGSVDGIFNYNADYLNNGNISGVNNLNFVVLLLKMLQANFAMTTLILCSQAT